MTKKNRAMTSPFNTAQEVEVAVAKMGMPPNFCHFPFVSLLLEPDGRVGSCRIKGTEFPVGNLNTHTLEEIWNGPVIREWRREFLSGNVLKCKTEVRHERCHTCPEYNAVLPEVVPAEYQTRAPLRLALNFNGHCNLECRMCHIWREPNGLYDKMGWWKQVEEWATGIRELELLSGEPFIQKDTYRLIDFISEKNPTCQWSITSNGHWHLSNKIKSSLDKIKFKHLIISIDSLDPMIYPKIRTKGTLSIVLDNLERLIQYDQSRIERGLDSLNIHLSFLVQQDNWHEIGEFHEFAKRKQLKVFRIFLYEPEQFSLLSLPEVEREKILEYYCKHLTPEQLKHSMRIYLPLLDSLNPLAKSFFLLEINKKIKSDSKN